MSWSAPATTSRSTACSVRSPARSVLPVGRWRALAVRASWPEQGQACVVDSESCQFVSPAALHWWIFFIARGGVSDRERGLSTVALRELLQVIIWPRRVRHTTGRSVRANEDTSTNMAVCGAEGSWSKPVCEIQSFGTPERSCKVISKTPLSVRHRDGIRRVVREFSNLAEALLAMSGRTIGPSCWNDATRLVLSDSPCLACVSSPGYPWTSPASQYQVPLPLQVSRDQARTSAWGKWH